MRRCISLHSLTHWRCARLYYALLFWFAPELQPKMKTKYGRSADQMDESMRVCRYHPVRYQTITQLRRWEWRRRNRNLSFIQRPEHNHIHFDSTIYRMPTINVIADCEMDEFSFSEFNGFPNSGSFSVNSRANFTSITARLCAFQNQLIMNWSGSITWSHLHPLPYHHVCTIHWHCILSIHSVTYIKQKLFNFPLEKYHKLNSSGLNHCLYNGYGYTYPMNAIMLIHLYLFWYWYF